MRPALPGHLPSPEKQYTVEQRPKEALFPTDGAAALSVEQAVPGCTPGTWEDARMGTSPAGGALGLLAREGSMALWALRTSWFTHPWPLKPALLTSDTTGAPVL